MCVCTHVYTCVLGLSQLLFAYILSCLGGTLLTALFLGQPVGWLSSDITFFTYIIVFGIAFSKWTRRAFLALVHAPIISDVITIMDDLSFGNSITTLGVQRVINPVHADSPIRHTVCAAIVGGITSGCGGGFIR